MGKAKVKQKSRPKIRTGTKSYGGERGAQGRRLSPDQDRRARSLIETESTVIRLNEFIHLDVSETELDPVLKDKYLKDLRARLGRKKVIPTTLTPAEQEVIKQWKAAKKKMMTSDQIRAAELMMKKSLPDLTHIELSGEASLNVDHTHTLTTAYEKLLGPKDKKFTKGPTLELTATSE